jgi:Tol biopolymer transport system component/tRNA A-37 threonylcarbamoyl transferase component Bud32
MDTPVDTCDEEHAAQALPRRRFPSQHSRHTIGGIVKIEAGQALLHYRLVEKIGEGGMGVVWKALDTTLDREVAIKLLPESLSGDAERLGRFEREAKLLASLNHPNIAVVHGLHAEDELCYLVMELVPGEDLAQRLQHGPLPVDRTKSLALQLAAALETAHEHGVIHRDLKPANVKMMPDGQVKVLDFGLAKAFDPAPASGTASPSLSPTLTSAGTMAGVILGTASYMSPEQARGQVVDRRADIWAFGCVLYECLTGEIAFRGNTVTDTLAAVVRAEPNWRSLPEGTPPALAEVVRRCLRKDAARRIRDVGDARIAIEESGDEGVDAAAAGGAVLPARRSILPWVLVAALALALAVVGLGVVRTPAPATETVRSSLLPPEGTRFYLGSRQPGPVSVSPDGGSIAFVARAEEGEPMLWVRALSATEPREIAGAESASYPFWSPDGREIGYFADGRLMRIAQDGGTAFAIADAPWGKGATWNENGVILFAPTYNGPICSVAETGGSVTPLTELDRERGDNSHRFPQFLPDGEHYIFLARTSDSGAGSAVVLASRGRGELRILTRSPANAVYASGHLLYVRESALLAQSFDPDRLRLEGEPRVVVPRVQIIPNAARTVMSAARETLVYQTAADTAGVLMTWFDRQGEEVGTLGEIGPHSEWTLSPGGRRLAVVTQGTRAQGSDIWIYDIERNIGSRATFDPGDEYEPVWSPDGRALMFISRPAGGLSSLYLLPGTGKTPEILRTGDEDHHVESWSPDGQHALYSAGADFNLYAIDLGNREERIPVLESSFRTESVRFSPGGDWFAFSSNESGSSEIYIASFPKADRKWRISRDGGDLACWPPDGDEVFFVNGNDVLEAVSIRRTDDGLEIGESERLFEVPGNFGRCAIQDDRFLFGVSESRSSTNPLSLVTNWTRSSE